LYLFTASRRQKTLCDLPGQTGAMQDLAFLAGEPQKSGCLEQGGPELSRHQSGSILQLRGYSKYQETPTMVEGCKTKQKLVETVERLYDWIEQQIRHGGAAVGKCNACGRCCDFESFDHRLFVTTPELLYLAEKLREDRVRTMTGSVCPYNQGGRCTVYEHRFAGCRIFFCSGQADFQSGLSEGALRKLKAICEEFNIPYSYRPLDEALRDFSAGSF